MDPVDIVGWSLVVITGLLALGVFLCYMYHLTKGFSALRTKPKITKEMREKWESRISVSYQGKSVYPEKTWKAQAIMYSDERGEDGRSVTVEDRTFYGRTRGGAERKARKFIDAARRERFSAWLVV